MTTGTVTTCDGFFEDDGPGGGFYSTTGSYTFTICADNPGDVIQVTFVAFVLNTNPNPNNSDYLLIYDGDSPAANSLGSYTGTSLQGLPVTGTVNNTSGCLTFVFNPNPNGPGNLPGWAAAISCTTPCDNPSASSQFIEPLPAPPNEWVGVCLDQEVTFAGVGSAPVTGFTIENYIWAWGDGTETIVQSNEEVSHAYSEPGEYIVNLFVQDNNGCLNLNLEPKQVLVSTIPLFNTEFDTPVCVGSPSTIDGNAIQSVTWTALPPQVSAGETFLADGAGFAYASSLIFDFFPVGAELESCEDLFSIFVNMEHSYLGDLEFFIVCPNGTQVTMMSFPNGGGGTFLGEAADDPGFTPGIGYDYGWSPTSTNGFINDNENWSNSPFTDVNGIFYPFANIVNPGTYESEQDLCNLVGCPLNGEWTFNITDNIGADNGYIFEWGIEFNPLLFPDITTFTPVIGLEADSSFWVGPNIVNTTNNGNTLEVLYDTPGFYDYTFTSTNNFGCAFDTTITIEAVFGPDITAGEDVFFCDEPVSLQAGLDAGVEPECGDDSGQYELCYGNNANLVFTYCPDNPGDGITFMGINITQGILENFWDSFTVYDGDNVGAPLIAGPLAGNLAGQSFEATNAQGCITLQIQSDGSVSCGSGSYPPLIYTVNCIAGGGLIWSWSPPTGLSDPNIQNPSAFPDQATVYTVSAYPPDLPGCVVTDQVLVAPDPGVDPGLDTDTVLCYNNPPSQLVSYLQGTPATNGVWVNNATGAIASGQFSPLDYPNGANFSFTYTLNNGVCEKSSVLNIEVLPAVDESCCLTNAVAGPDGVACSLTYVLQAFETIGSGQWSGPSNVSFSNINDPNTTVTCSSPGGTITLTWTDTIDQLCSEQDEVTIVFSDPLEIVLLPTDARCNGECSGSAIAIPQGGTPDASGIYNYLWSEGDAGISGQIIEGLCVGGHSVKVVDNFGCSDSVDFAIGEPDAQQILALTAPPLCADSCNGKVTIFSEGAIEYSYDSTDTWYSSNIIELCEGTYTVYARNNAGCTIPAEVTLVDPVPFEASFNINPNPTTTKNTLVEFQNTSTPGPIASSLWLFGEAGSAGMSELRFTQWRFPTDTSGTYPITLLTESVNGCVDTLTRLLVINDDILWYIPNAFSPNGDVINELWKPEGSFVDLTDYQLEIYDRWGQRVFYTTDFMQSWNGSVNGSAYFAQQGVYVYYIKVASITTEEIYELNGFITLVR
jgi:gliding motility-associated-like protein